MSNNSFSKHQEKGNFHFTFPPNNLSRLLLSKAFNPSNDIDYSRSLQVIEVSRLIDNTLQQSLDTGSEVSLHVSYRQFY